MATIKLHHDSIIETNVTRSMVKNQHALAYKTLEGYGDGSKSLKWFGVRGGAEAVRDTIRQGWKDGVTRMMDAFGQIGGEFQATSIKRQVVRGDYGDELDIHRVHSGDLGNAWTRRKRQRKQSPSIITIGCNLALNAGQHSDELFWRGAAVLRLADVLTEAGYAVEIVAWNMTNRVAYGETHVEQTVVVKHSGEPLDLSNVAAALCLSGFNRLNLFEQYTKHVDNELRGGLGQPDYHAVPDEYANAIVCGGHVTNVTAAREWLKTAVAAFSNDYREAA